MDKIAVVFTFLALVAILCIVESKDTLMCRCDDDVCKITNSTCITTGVCVLWVIQYVNGVVEKHRGCTPGIDLYGGMCDYQGYLHNRDVLGYYSSYCCDEDMCNTVDKTANITFPTLKPLTSHFSTKDFTGRSGSTGRSGGKSSTTTIAAAVAGATCVICALIVSIIRCRYKKGQQKQQKQFKVLP